MVYDMLWVNDSEQQAVVSTETNQTEAKQEEEAWGAGK